MIMILEVGYAAIIVHVAKGENLCIYVYREVYHLSIGSLSIQLDTHMCQELHIHLAQDSQHRWLKVMW